jgi:hypothetical protein
LTSGDSVVKLRNVPSQPPKETEPEKRRSLRVMIRVPVRIEGHGPNTPPVSEDTHTSLVNAHGALVYLETKVMIGQLVKVTNLVTQEEVSCHIAFVGQTQSGKTAVGVEFVKPSPRFWRIAFPPEDWSRHSPEAKSSR